MKKILNNLAFLFRPLSFAKFKVLGFTIFISGTSIKWYVKFNYETKEIEIMSGSDELIYPILATIIFLILVIMDYHHFSKKQRFEESKYKLLNSPDISIEIKENIIREFP